MGTIAKGEITLSPVNDAYTVSVTPASCTISAEFDGTIISLDNAKGTITVKRGSKVVPFHVTTPHISTGGGVQFGNTSESVVAFEITALPSDVLNGTVSFDIVTDDGFNYSTTVGFAFNIVRESTMLDWIQDWEGSKTKVGGTYIMTPKLFVGKKEDVVEYIENETVDSYTIEAQWKAGCLTGVYIGPDLLSSGESSVGIYGYLKDKEIFHINGDGGLIGGWSFNEAGLQSSNGVVNILSEGTIYAQNPDSTTPYWGIYANGYATFANGNVKFYGNGSAEYAGKITASSGKIGGWSINEDWLSCGAIALDSDGRLIGVINQVNYSYINDAQFIQAVKSKGGVYMCYSDANDYGIWGYSLDGQLVFTLGSTNYIAGWNFDNTAIYLGTKQNTAHQYTSASGEITIGTSGLRGANWYIDTNGDISFVSGLLEFTKTGGTICGWMMSTSGICTTDNTLRILASGAISAYNGTDVVWQINKSGEATFSKGLVYFAKDGSGWVANQNINWDEDGNLTIKGLLKQEFAIIERTEAGGEMLDFDKYHNFAVYQSENLGIKCTYLPNDMSYNGATIRLYYHHDNTEDGTGAWWLALTNPKSKWLYADGEQSAFKDSTNTSANGLQISPDCMVVLTAIPDSSGEFVNWYIENYGGGIFFI